MICVLPLFPTWGQQGFLLTCGVHCTWKDDLEQTWWRTHVKCKTHVAVLLYGEQGLFIPRRRTKQIPDSQVGTVLSQQACHDHQSPSVVPSKFPFSHQFQPGHTSHLSTTPATSLLSSHTFSSFRQLDLSPRFTVSLPGCCVFFSHSAYKTFQHFASWPYEPNPACLFPIPALALPGTLTHSLLSPVIRLA